MRGLEPPRLAALEPKSDVHRLLVVLMYRPYSEHHVTSASLILLLRVLFGSNLDVTEGLYFMGKDKPNFRKHC